METIPEFESEIGALSRVEKDAKLFSICLVYLLRNMLCKKQVELLIRMTERFQIRQHVRAFGFAILPERPFPRNQNINARVDEVVFLFESLGRKTVYHFNDGWGLSRTCNCSKCRWRFVRHPDGRLMVFQQLARSGSDLPYFITNGSTPQGIFHQRYCVSHII